MTPKLGVVLVALVFHSAPHAGVEEGRQKAQVCVACHGEDGNSKQPAIPSLAGQPKQFLVSALYQFRAGKRVNALMSPMAANLSNADLNDLAAYFNSQVMAPATHKTAPANVVEGQRLTQVNNCVACHTPKLIGQQHIPRIASQHFEYLREQLSHFKASTRADMDGTMTSAAQGLSAQDIEVLADYLAGLEP